MKRRLALSLLTLLAATSPASAYVRQQPAAQAEESRLNASVVKFYNEGKYDEALPLAQRVLELREKAHGPGHLLVAFALKNLASIHVEKNDSGEAEKLYRRALEILEKHGKPQASAASDVAVQLGILKFRARDYGEAEALFERGVALKEQAVGAEGRGVAYPLFILADFRLVRDGFEKAEPFYDRAMRLLENSPPQRDPSADRQLKELLCRLDGPRGKQMSKRVYKLLYRLDNPEQAAESERQEKEREKQQKAKGVYGVTLGEGDEDEGVVGVVLNGRAISKPAPSYPELAMRARAQGTVIVYITVDEQGRVMKAEAFCGHPLLRESSVQAAMKARFSPTLLSGVPVKVTGVITYNYVLR
jgi:TonB family protein